MKVSTLSAALLLPALAVAIPTHHGDAQLSIPGLAGKVVDTVEKWWTGAEVEVEHAWKSATGVVEGMVVQDVEMDGTDCECAGADAAHRWDEPDEQHYLAVPRPISGVHPG